MTRTLLTVIATCASLTVPVAPATASDAGLFGIGQFSVGASALFGDRLGGGGFGLAAHLEWADLAWDTMLGNMMGIELAMDIGYESFAGQDPHGGSTQGPFLFDVSLGFPLTLLYLGNGGPGSTLFTMSLGAGVGVQHAYGYLRGRILTALSPRAYLEVMGRWTPAEASHDWTERTGLDVYQLRLSAFFYVSDSLRMQVFGEWVPMSRTRVAEEDPRALATFPPENVTEFQSVLRFGVGFVF